jgi:predicted PurR-regulated permease PerM
MVDSQQSIMRPLVAAACVVIVAWGIRAASHVLLVLLISLFFAYVIFPFPRWLIKRFKLATPAALALTMTLVGIIYVIVSFLLYRTALRMMVRLPSYEVHFTALYQQITSFLNAHGTHYATVPPAGYFSSERVAEFAIDNLSNMVGLLSDRLLVWLLSLLFLVEIVEQDESKRGPFGGQLIRYGGDIQRFIAISAKTGAITAAANLVVLVALGVDFPILWCALYFFLQFIPSVGYLIALVPPTFLELLLFGWKRALLVAGALILTQLLADYVLLPMFMKKGLQVSLLTIMLSLVGWGFLLGPWGGILAVPLTLALRKFIGEHSKEGAPVLATSR